LSVVLFSMIVKQEQQDGWPVDGDSSTWQMYIQAFSQWMPYYVKTVPSVSALKM
jgi:hypothetical protein